MGRTRNQKPVEKKEKLSQRKVKYKKEITPRKEKIISSQNRNQTPTQGNSSVTSEEGKQLTPLLHSKRGKSEKEQHDKNDGTVNGKYNIRLLYHQ